MASGQRAIDGFFPIIVLVFISAAPVWLGYNCWKKAQLRELVASYVDCHNQLTEQLEEVTKAYGEAEQRLFDAEWTLHGVTEKVDVLVTDMARRMNQSRFLVNLLHEMGYAEHHKGHDEWKFQLKMMKHVEDRLSETEKEMFKQYDVIWKLFYKHIESRREPSENTLRVRKRLELKSASQSKEYPPQKSSGVTKEARSEGAAKTEVPQDTSSDKDKFMRSLPVIFFSHVGAEVLVFCLVAFVHRRYTDSHSGAVNYVVATFFQCGVLYALCGAISFHHTPAFLVAMTSFIAASNFMLATRVWRAIVRQPECGRQNMR